MRPYDPMTALAERERELQERARDLAIDLQAELDGGPVPVDDLAAYAEGLRSKFNDRVPNASQCRFWRASGATEHTVALLSDLRSKVTTWKERAHGR